MKIPAGEKHIIITVVALCACLLLLLAWTFRKKLAVMIFDTYIVENKEAFLQKVKQISQNLGIQPDWLMAVMAIESGINHRAVNKTSGATGLIQFMPSTAIGLGTTTDALRAMSNVQQLSYVEKYLMPFKGKMNRFTDVYLAVFYPAAMGKPDSYVIGAAGSKVAEQNKIFQDAQGAVTVGSFKNYITNWVAKKGFTII
ncbi:MAG: lytic transglycosylase domain-containing protein [Bacteroidetes bacterium]|nr:lytic transglycosylase domain-containing protein [Bacteroidota bacterium]